MQRSIPVRYTVEGEQRVIQATDAMAASNQRMFQGMAHGGDAGARSIHQMHGKLTLANTELSRMAQQTNAAFNFLVAGLVGQGVRQLGQYADSYKALKGQIATVTETEEEATRVREALFRISEDTRTQIGTTGTLYGRLSRATEEYGISEAKRLKVTELANKAAKIGQSTTQEQTSALIQLSQGIASGRVQGEELKSVMENTPELARAIADGLGVSIGKLKEMGAEGDLTAERVLDAIIKMEASINERFAKVPVRVAEGFDVLSTGITQYVGEIDEARGISESVGEALKLMGENIDTIGSSISVVAVALAGAYSGRLLGSIGKATKETLAQANAHRRLAAEALASTRAEKNAASERLGQALLSYQITGKNVRELAIAQKSAEKAAIAHTAAIANFNRVGSVSRQVMGGFLGIVGGVPGILSMAAFAALAYGDSLFTATEATNTQTDALETYLKRLGDTEDALESLSEKQLKFARTQAEADVEGAGNVEQEVRDRIAGVLSREAYDIRNVVSNTGRFGGFAALPGSIERDVADSLMTLSAAARDGSISAEDLNDQLSGLESVLPDIAGMTSELADELNQLASAASESADKASKLAEVEIRLGGGALSPRPSDTDPIGKAPDILKKGGEVYTGLFDAFGDLDKAEAYLAALERANEILTLRAAGREAEAEALETQLELEQAIGTEAEMFNDAVREQLGVRKELTAEIKRQKAIDKQEETLKRRIVLARQELDVLKARRDGNADLADTLERQFALAAEFPDLSEAQLSQLEKILATQDQITEEMADQKQLARQQQDLSRFFFDAWTNEGANFWDLFGDMGKKTITDLMSSFVTTGGFGDMATIFNPDSTQLGQFLGGVDGQGGVIRAFGLDSLFGLDAGGVGSLAGSLTSIFGGTSAGMAIGQLLGAGGTTSGILSGAGSVAGNLFGGPVGGFVGGLVGGGLSAIFGGGHDKAATTVRVDSSGQAAATSTRTKSDGDASVSQGMANAVADGLNTIAAQLGGALTGGLLVGEVGHRNDKYFFDPTANASRGDLGEPGNDPDTVRFDTADAAVEAAIIDALRSGAVTGLPDEVMARLRNVTAGSLEQILGDIQVFTGLSAAIEEGLSEVVDPLEAGLNAIKDEYQQAVESYQAFGADIADVNQFYLQQQEAFIEEYRAAAIAPLNDFLSSLATGQFAGLSPLETLDANRAAFEALAAEVGAGTDVDDQALITAANAFLEASLAVNSFTSDFFADRSYVEDTVSREIANFNASVDDTLSTADLIQPLDTLADIGNTTNDLLQDVVDLLQQGAGGYAGAGGGGAGSYGGGHVRLY